MWYDGEIPSPARKGKPQMEKPRGQPRCQDQRGTQGPKVLPAGSDPAAAQIPASGGEEEVAFQLPSCHHCIFTSTDTHKNA